MSVGLLAEFRDPKALLGAIESAEQNGHRVVDAFLPYPDEAILARLPMDRSRVHPAMLAGGLLAAAAAYALQVYSAVWAYPLNSGGRPLHSWPVFLLVPFELGILAAGISGIIAFFIACGLPRLHHPLFDAAHFERATSDRYFLIAEPSAGTRNLERLRMLLQEVGAITVAETGQRS